MERGEWCTTNEKEIYGSHRAYHLRTTDDVKEEHGEFQQMPQDES